MLDRGMFSAGWGNGRAPRSDGTRPGRSCRHRPRSRRERRRTRGAPGQVRRRRGRTSLTQPPIERFLVGQGSQR